MHTGTMLRGSRKTRVNVPPRRPSERASSGGIDRAPRDAPRGEAPRGIPRCEVDPDTRAANEVRGGNIGPSLEGKIEASSLFTKEAIRTKDYLLTQNTFNFHSLGVAQSVWHSLLTKRVGGSILGGANYFYFQT